MQAIYDDVGNQETLVLLHPSRCGKEVVAFAQLLVDTLDAACLALLLYLQSHLRSLVLGEEQFGKVDIAVGALQVLQLKPHHLYLLHQFVVVGIQGIQYIHCVVVLLMGGGVVEREERIEGLEGSLRGCASHLLRFIEDDDGVVTSKHLDRFA